MQQLTHWQRWVMAIVGLPSVVVFSTFIVSQTQIGQLVSMDMSFQSTFWTALQLSLASGLVWLVWRTPSTKRNWAIIGKSVIEGIVLCGMSLIVMWLLGFTDTTWQISIESIIAMVGLALPIAWWSMAEERVLRGELQTLLGNMPSLLRDLIMLSVGWCVQMSLISVHSMFVAIVLLLTEGLSVITWSGHDGFERAWARRWVWRWLFVVVFGVSSTGFVTATPSPLIVMVDDPFISLVLVTTPITLWLIFTIVHNHATKYAP
ncbi:MAG: hypothetical protein ACO3F2_03460 [Roseiflexaceae bacterium]